MSQKTEWEKMVAGELFAPWDQELKVIRDRAQDLTYDFNLLRETEDEKKQEILSELFGTGGDLARIRAPFNVDYGKNIHLEGFVFFNFGCVILDVCPVRFGKGVAMGPGVHIYTAMHPLHVEQRATHFFGKPVTIGSGVWIGGGAIICPGVTIGDHSVIGAGSVVTRDIPDGVLAVGNPCKVVRKITDAEKQNVPAGIPPVNPFWGSMPEPGE